MPTKAERVPGKRGRRGEGSRLPDAFAMQGRMRTARERLEIEIQAVWSQDMTQEEKLLQEGLPLLLRVGGDIDRGGRAPVEEQLTASAANGFHHGAVFLSIINFLGDDFKVNAATDGLVVVKQLEPGSAKVNGEAEVAVKASGGATLMPLVPGSRARQAAAECKLSDWLGQIH